MIEIGVHFGDNGRPLGAPRYGDTLMNAHLRALATRVKHFFLAAILLAFATSVVAQPSTQNHTALWWNPAESGWGLNVTHQGGIVFATLFTYDASGAPLWLVMSKGDVQADGITYTGDLYRTTGPVFNANPFTPIGASNLTKVGTMSIQFASQHVAFLTYSVNGISVTKTLQKQMYGKAAASCVPTTNTNRAALTNYQDLWFNAAESGWGINITHQDDILFATLFTYDASSKGLWLVMSAGAKQADGSYSGDLYRTTGSAFNANPFTPIGAGNLTKVGTMQLRFSDGQTGTLTYSVNGINVTKSITRQVFSSPVLACTTPAMAFTPKLLLPLGSPSTVSGFPAMILLDLSTGQLTQAGISSAISLGCTAGNLRNDSRVRIACGLGSSHWDYNPVTNSVTQNTALAKLPGSNWTVVLSGPDGADYYGVGQYVVPGTGKVLKRVANAFVGEVLTTAPGATPTTYASPFRLVSDFANGKAFTLNDNNYSINNPLRVDRIDVASMSVDASISGDRHGVGVSLYQGELYVAMARNNAGKDVVKYNSITLTKSGEGATEGTTGAQGVQHVFALAIDASGVHLGIYDPVPGGTQGGVQTLSHDLMRAVRTTKFPSDTEVADLAAYDGKLYIITGNTTSVDNLRELDSRTHTVLRKWSVPGWPYRPVVIAP